MISLIRYALALVVCNGIVSLAQAQVTADVTWGVGFSVSPPSVTIRAGESVRWNGNMASHPIAESNATFSSVGTVLQNTGSSYTRSFAAAGTYYFICAFHPSMQSTVIVQPQAVTCTPPSNTAVLDIDANGQVNAATDGVLVVRYMLGFRGDALFTGALAVAPLPLPTRTRQQIEDYLGACIVP